MLQGNLIVNSANYGNINDPNARYNYGGGVAIAGRVAVRGCVGDGPGLVSPEISDEG